MIGAKDPEAQQPVLERLKAQTGNANLRALKLDLSDLDSIKSFSDELKTLCDHVDILIENAGILATERRTTKNGFESGTLMGLLLDLFWQIFTLLPGFFIIIRFWSESPGTCILGVPVDATIEGGSN